MKGNKELLAVLNSLLADELTVINQYMVQSEMCANWGYSKLHKAIRKQAMEEGHVDWAEIQRAQIEQMGIENYLVSQIESPAS